jgi:RHS repeat-associated protein
VETISGLPRPDFFPRLTDLTYNANRMATQNTDFISGIPIYSPAAVYAYDNAGNIVSDGLHTDYFYNQNNRLIRVEIDGLTIAEYAYDAFERRVLKVVNGVTTHFHYDLNGLLISETDGNGNPRKDYVYLNGEPLAMKAYGGSAGWYWFINDHLGTPQKMVDESGNVVWAAAYAPFGEARVYRDEITNNLRFPGQYYDVETGLHYNWHRYYDSGTGRYLRPDPIGLAGGINPYVYALNSPANWIDPDGEIPVFAGVVIGKVLAVGVGYVGAKIAAAFVSEEASDGVDMAMGKVTAINASEIAGMAAGEIAGAAIGFGIRGVRTCATKKAGKGLGNPFKDKSAKEIDQMFKDKGFRESGPDPLNGKGGYVDPKTGRSYHIDPKEYGKYREANHVDVNRPRGYKGPLDKKKLPYKE